MTGNPILLRFWSFRNRWRSHPPARRPDLHTLWLHPDRLPKLVTDTPSALRILDLLGPLDWAHFPERNLQRNWGHPTVPYAAFAAACLVKLNEGLVSMGDLREYLVEHPAFIWLCGFPLQPSPCAPCGFDAEASLPSQRHLTHMLRAIPNVTLQFLLTDSVRLILAELHGLGVEASDCISLDTKHVIGWVKENNPKAYVENRYDKTQQPKGDPDCRLGCKRRHNRKAKQPLGQDPSPGAQPPGGTPTRNPLPARTLQVGEFYWGYGSGVIVVKVPGWGEFVLAEMTQPFDQGDVTYFFPLMGQAEQRLGFRPRFGTFDAAFDAWYVYAHFHREDDPQAFAAVPFSEKGGYKAKGRQFTPEGLPMCAARLPMPLKFTYIDRTTCIIEHERGKYVCPLRFPMPSTDTCPVNHKQWPKGGCTVTMPISIGARLRYTLDRDSEAYKAIYRQRTAVERINSQAVALGIERPHWRNGRAIANLNTLIYTLINLRMLQRIRQRKPQTD
jgi:hypothetical protein